MEGTKQGKRLKKKKIPVIKTQQLYLLLGSQWEIHHLQVRVSLSLSLTLLSLATHMGPPLVDQHEM